MSECSHEKARISFSSIKLNNLTRLEEKLQDIKEKTSLVHIYFRQLGIVKYSRDRLFGFMDVIGELWLRNDCCCRRFCAIIVFVAASFGGMVGLCMGFSILSGFEVIYFFTVRLLVDRHREARCALNDLDLIQPNYSSTFEPPLLSP